MEPALAVYLFCLAVLVAILLGIAIRAFSHWKTPGTRTLGALILTMAVWAAFYILEVIHPSLEVKILARKMLYFGMTMAPPFWLAFALRYTGLGAWWSQQGRVFLFAIPGGIAFLFGLTNEFHHLIWSDLSLSATKPVLLTIEYGIGFWVYAILAYLQIFVGLAIYLVAHFKNKKAFRTKTGIVLAGLLLTAIVNVLFLLFGNSLNVDPTPLSFALSAPLIAWGFFRFGVSSLFPLAASLVVENLQDAIIIVNREDEITDINQTAAELINLKTVKEKSNIFTLLPFAEQLKPIWDAQKSSIKLETNFRGASQWVEAQVIPIKDHEDSLLGRVIVLHDITKEQALLRAERRRSQQLSLLEQTGRYIAGSFDEQEILQRTVDAITQQFGYPETAISLLKNNMFEIAAIFGTEDFGYRQGYRQEIGSGIIGYTASIKKTYVSRNVSQDPYYYSTSTKSGSAICTPIFKQDALYGVLYVESFDLDAFDELDIITLETLASQMSASLQRAELYAQTQNDLLTLRTIQNISKLITSSLDLETISQTVVRSLKESFDYTHVSIYLLEDEYLHLAAEVGYPKELVIYKIHISQGVIGKAYRTRSIQFIEDTTKEKVFLKADNHITSEICIPLLKEDIVLGMLNVESNVSNKLSQRDVTLLTTIAGPIAIAVDNARLHTEIKRMATTDAVTGLSNRHVFEQALLAEFERAERSHSQMSLIIFDIDFFKQYNDIWGHPAGDARLKGVANIIKLNLRKYDIAARYGGDEFAIILANCDQQSAMTFAQRLQQGTIAGAPQQSENDAGIPGYTLSIGIATYPQDATLPSELLVAADNAALRAKLHGRNQIKFANDYE
ncbi:MAG TPA: diguanylate cyclase [Anaerolineales bacterium]|nr:diguanylate cyclase [Anaerolineales bacterium]